MTPIKFVKLNDNMYDYDTMLLVNMISHKNEIMYYFIVDSENFINNKRIPTKDLIEVPEEDYNDEIYLNYTIV
jgi:hypothetical protein